MAEKREILSGQTRPCTPEQKVKKWEGHRAESANRGVTLAWSELGGEGHGSRRNLRENVRRQKGLLPARISQDELNTLAFVLLPSTGAETIWTCCRRIFGWFGGAWCPWNVSSPGVYVPVQGPVVRRHRELPDLMLCARETGEREKGV